MCRICNETTELGQHCSAAREIESESRLDWIAKFQHDVACNRSEIVSYVDAVCVTAMISNIVNKYTIFFCTWRMISFDNFDDRKNSVHLRRGALPRLSGSQHDEKRSAKYLCCVSFNLRASIEE